MLLIHVSDGNTDIQKLIAFDNAFEKIFNIIELEGGLDGGIIVEDCLELLSTLLAFNSTTQNQFRETSFIATLGKLLALDDTEEVAEYANEQRNINIVKTLGVIRLFAVPGGSSTTENQKALFNSGTSQQVLNLAFSTKVELDVRAEVCTLYPGLKVMLTVEGSESLRRPHPWQQRVTTTICYVASTIQQPLRDWPRPIEW